MGSGTSSGLKPARSASTARVWLWSGLLPLGALVGCAGQAVTEADLRPPAPPPAGTPPLRTLSERRGLPIGTAADRTFRLQDEAGALFKTVLSREFNVLTPENDMKFSRLRPAPDLYDFARADSLVVFAEANEMKVRGHTLVWHRQLAPWLTSGTWTRDQAQELLAEHIARVVGHYRGRLVAWDVVNEAIADDASLRSTFWSDHLGRDYIEHAFRWAHEADPDVALFYNDYGIEWMNEKADSVYALMRDLLARGVPVHGIGFQAHFEVGRAPHRDELTANFARFAALGLKIHITELDVRIRQPATEEQFILQAEIYRDVVGVCLRSPACEMVVTWGFTDRDSWIPNAFPGFGEALLFDGSYRPKRAYWLLHALLNENW
jgi:endo-1,4-beta-xylanase